MFMGNFAKKRDSSLPTVTQMTLVIVFRRFLRLRPEDEAPTGQQKNQNLHHKGHQVTRRFTKKIKGLLGVPLCPLCPFVVKALKPVEKDRQLFVDVSPIHYYVKYVDGREIALLNKKSAKALFYCHPVVGFIVFRSSYRICVELGPVFFLLSLSSHRKGIAIGSPINLSALAPTASPTCPQILLWQKGGLHSMFR